MLDGKITFGLIVSTRGCFNFEMAVEGKRQLVSRLATLGHGHIVLADDATPTGCVEGRPDGVKCAELFGKNRDKIDGVIIVLPNFGDEMGVMAALDGARLDVPILLQASDDRLDRLGTRERRDSFCGKLSIANNLWQYGYAFTDTASHTVDIDSDAFAADIGRFAAICRTYRGLRRARIGQIGVRPGCFQTVRISEKLLQASGLTVVPADLSEILGTVSRLDDGAAEVKNARERLAEYGNVCPEASGAQLLRQAKLTAAIEKWIAENEVDAVAMQCWDSIEQNYGCAACATMSMLSDRLIPAACEADVGGAVAMYALSLAAGNASALLDWNNNYGDAADKCVCTHCGNNARSFIYGANPAGKPEISYLDVLSTTLGKDNCFGAVKGKVKAGDMTFFRVSSDDRSGCMRAYLGQGAFTDDPFAMSGCIAVCEVPELRKFMGHIVKNGFEHHVAMVRGHIADIVEEAAGNYLGWDLYRHS
ncbi:MAG: fucose isomerase [Planctomycetota bacterium]|jgi:L-fucose isomerase-like protein|nr:fucose isomerase [Planctomycetota bacterium]